MVHPIVIDTCPRSCWSGWPAAAVAVFCGGRYSFSFVVALVLQYPVPQALSRNVICSSFLSVLDFVRKLYVRGGEMVLVTGVYGAYLVWIV